jgi:hypothetical protein
MGRSLTVKDQDVEAERSSRTRLSALARSSEGTSPGIWIAKSLQARKTTGQHKSPPERRAFRGVNGVTEEGGRLRASSCSGETLPPEVGQSNCRAWGSQEAHGRRPAPSRERRSSGSGGSWSGPQHATLPVQSRPAGHRADRSLQRRLSPSNSEEALTIEPLVDKGFRKKRNVRTPFREGSIGQRSGTVRR